MKNNPGNYVSASLFLFCFVLLLIHHIHYFPSASVYPLTKNHGGK